jgi:hypothetical protein
MTYQFFRKRPMLVRHPYIEKNSTFGKNEAFRDE